MWACEVCTFHNAPVLRLCEMCGTPRVAAGGGPAVGGDAPPPGATGLPDVLLPPELLASLGRPGSAAPTPRAPAAPPLSEGARAAATWFCADGCLACLHGSSGSQGGDTRTASCAGCSGSPPATRAASWSLVPLAGPRPHPDGLAAHSSGAVADDEYDDVTTGLSLNRRSGGFDGVAADGWWGGYIENLPQLLRLASLVGGQPHSPHPSLLDPGISGGGSGRAAHRSSSNRGGWPAQRPTDSGTLGAVCARAWALLLETLGRLVEALPACESEEALPVCPAPAGCGAEELPPLTVSAATCSSPTTAITTSAGGGGALSHGAGGDGSDGGTVWQRAASALCTCLGLHAELFASTTAAAATTGDAGFTLAALGTAVHALRLLQRCAHWPADSDAGGTRSQAARVRVVVAAQLRRHGMLETAVQLAAAAPAAADRVRSGAEPGQLSVAAVARSFVVDLLAATAVSEPPLAAAFGLSGGGCFLSPPTAAEIALAVDASAGHALATVERLSQRVAALSLFFAPPGSAPLATAIAALVASSRGSRDESARYDALERIVAPLDGGSGSTSSSGGSGGGVEQRPALPPSVYEARRAEFLPLLLHALARSRQPWTEQALLRLIELVHGCLAQGLVAERGGSVVMASAPLPCSPGTTAAPPRAAVTDGVHELLWSPRKPAAAGTATSSSSPSSASSASPRAPFAPARRVDTAPPLRLGEVLTRLSRPLAVRLVPAAHDPLLQLLGLAMLPCSGGFGDSLGGGGGVQSNASPPWPALITTLAVPRAAWADPLATLGDLHAALLGKVTLALARLRSGLAAHLAAVAAELRARQAADVAAATAAAAASAAAAVSAAAASAGGSLRLPAGGHASASAAAAKSQTRLPTGGSAGAGRDGGGSGSGDGSGGDARVAKKASKSAAKIEVQCRFFARGHCRNGHGCRFLHGGGGDKAPPVAAAAAVAPRAAFEAGTERPAVPAQMAASLAAAPASDSTAALLAPPPPPPPAPSPQPILPGVGAPQTLQTLPSSAGAARAGGAAVISGGGAAVSSGRGVDEGRSSDSAAPTHATAGDSAGSSQLQQQLQALASLGGALVGGGGGLVPPQDAHRADGGGGVYHAMLRAMFEEGGEGTGSGSGGGSSGEFGGGESHIAAIEHQMMQLLAAGGASGGDHGAPHPGVSEEEAAADEDDDGREAESAGDADGGGGGGGRGVYARSHNLLGLGSPFGGAPGGAPAGRRPRVRVSRTPAAAVAAPPSTAEVDAALAYGDPLDGPCARTVGLVCSGRSRLCADGTRGDGTEGAASSPPPQRLQFFTRIGTAAAAGSPGGSGSRAGSRGAHARSLEWMHVADRLLFDTDFAASSAELARARGVESQAGSGREGDMRTGGGSDTGFPPYVSRSAASGAPPPPLHLLHTPPAHALADRLIMAKALRRLHVSDGPPTTLAAVATVPDAGRSGGWEAPGSPTVGFRSAARPLLSASSMTRREAATAAAALAFASDAAGSSAGIGAPSMPPPPPPLAPPAPALPRESIATTPVAAPASAAAAVSPFIAADTPTLSRAPPAEAGVGDRGGVGGSHFMLHAGWGAAAPPLASRGPVAGGGSALGVVPPPPQLGSQPGATGVSPAPATSSPADASRGSRFAGPPPPTRASESPLAALTRPQLEAHLAAVQHAFATAAAVSLRGVWFALHHRQREQQHDGCDGAATADDQLATPPSTAAAVVVWGPGLHDHTLLERLGCTLSPANPWATVHTITWGTLGLHALQRPPRSSLPLQPLLHGGAGVAATPLPPPSSSTAIDPRPAARAAPPSAAVVPVHHDFFSSGLLHSHARHGAPALLLPCPAEPLARAAHPTFGRLAAVPPRVAPLQLHAAVLRRLYDNLAAVQQQQQQQQPRRHGQRPASHAPLRHSPQLARAVTRLLTDPLAVVGHAAWLASTPLLSSASSGDGESGGGGDGGAGAGGPAALWAALTTFPQLLPLPLRVRLFEATAFGVRRAIDGCEAQRAAAAAARRALANGGGGAAASSQPAISSAAHGGAAADPLAADELADEEDDEGDAQDEEEEEAAAAEAEAHAAARGGGGMPWRLLGGGGRRGGPTAASHGLSLPSQKAVVSRQRVLHSALALLGPAAAPPGLETGGELLALGSLDGSSLLPLPLSAGAAPAAPPESSAAAAAAVVTGGGGGSSVAAAAAPAATVLPSLALALAEQDHAYAIAAEAHVAVQFSHEAGHGIGPTVEFLTLTCTQLHARDLRLWLDTAHAGDDGEEDEEGGEGGAGGAAHGLHDSSSSGGGGGGGGGGGSPSGGGSRSGGGRGGSQSLVRPAEGGLHPLPMLPPPVAAAASAAAGDPSTAGPPQRLLAATAAQARALHHLELAGRVAGKALSERRLLDLPLSEPFLRAVLRGAGGGGGGLDHYTGAGDAAGDDRWLGAAEGAAVERSGNECGSGGGGGDAGAATHTPYYPLLRLPSERDLADVTSVAPAIGRTLRHLLPVLATRDAAVRALLPQGLETPPAAAAADYGDAAAGLEGTAVRSAPDATAAAAAAAAAASDTLLALSASVEDLCLEFSFPGGGGGGGGSDGGGGDPPATLLPLLPVAAAAGGSCGGAGGGDSGRALPDARVAAGRALAAACVGCRAVPWYYAAAAAAAPPARLPAAAAGGRPPAPLRPPPPPPPPVTLASLHVYVAALVDAVLGAGLALPVAAFTRGLRASLPAGARALAVFTPREAAQLLCGGDATRNDALWTPAAIAPHVVTAHGYTPESPQVAALLATLGGFSHAERRLFLRFVTGSPRLPARGWGGLVPRLTVVRAVPPSPAVPADSLLPTVSTCQVYLKLPPYSSARLLGAKLRTAIREGQEAFSFD